MKRRRWLRTLVGVSAGLAILGLVAWAAWRMYGPGDIATRLERAGRRWQPFYDPDLAPGIWRFVGFGLVSTLTAAVVSIGLSLVFGLALALMRLSRFRLLTFPGGTAVRNLVAAPAAVLVQAIRSSPLFLLILYTYLAAPDLGLDLNAMQAGIFALTLYTSCVMAEIMRAGILSLERGQFEAAASLGLGYSRAMRLVVLPQALRRMTPAAVSQLVTLVKDTSLLSYIAVVELTNRLKIIGEGYTNPIEAYIVAGAVYFVLNFALSTVGRRLEAKPGRREVTARLQSVGSEDQTPAAA